MSTQAITVDLTEVDTLIGYLERASQRPLRERSRLLREVGREVAEEARAMAAARWYTGELARSVAHHMVGQTAVRIHGPVRQAFFLEYGSPNTGAPYPWLSRPAERGAEQLLARLGKEGELW